MAAGYEEEQDTLGIPLYSSSTVSVEQDYWDNSITLNAKEIYRNWEEPIGSWTNWKTIYRKVIEVTLPTLTGSWQEVADAPDDMELMTNIRAVGTNHRQYPRYEGTSYYLQFDVTSTKIKVRGAGYNGAVLYIIMEYTKTTD